MGLLDLADLLNTKAVNGSWPLEDSKFVLQSWHPEDVVEDEDYNAADIELYKLDAKGAVDKIVESKRGDLRMMSRVEIED